MPSYDYIKRNQKGWEKAPSIKRLQQKRAKSSWIPTVVQKTGIWRLTLAVTVWEKKGSLGLAGQMSSQIGELQGKGRPSLKN